MTSRFVVALALLCLAGAGAVWPAEEIRLASDPLGAEVWVAPADQPGLYHKGVTPCALTLSPTGAPYRLVLRAPGCFPVFRTLTAADTDLKLTLRRRDDPQSWQAVPALYYTGGRWWAAGSQTPAPFSGVPTYPDGEALWAPDGEGLVVRGTAWYTWVTQLGIGKQGENRELCDVWYAPRQGAAVRVWRYLSGPNGGTRFEIDAAFSPDGRWIVHSTPEVTREHLELYSLLSGRHRVVAREQGATLFNPVFSPDGRRLASLRYQERRGDEERRAYPPCELQVIQWDGQQRRTVARDARGQFAPGFSPDGSRLAYVTVKGAVAVVPVAGGQARAVLASDGWAAAGSPQWSPDGTAVAADFAADDDRRGEPGETDDPCRVRWGRVDGSGGGALLAVRLQAWQSDNSLGVYAAGYCAAAGARYRCLLRVGLDGTQQQLLAAPALIHRRVSSTDNTRAAALQSTPEGRQAVVLVTAAEHSVQRWTAPPLAAATQVGWLDDETLWVCLPEGHDPPAYRLRIADGALEPLSELPPPPPRDERGLKRGPPGEDEGALQSWDGLVPGGNWQIPLPGGWFSSLAPTVPGGGEAQ